MDALSKHLFIFLPYLRTKTPVAYRGLKFRSTSDERDIPPEALADFAALINLFYLRDDYRLQDMTYTYLSGPGDQKDHPLLRHAFELQTLLAYLYSAPRSQFNDLFLTAEHATLYQCIPASVPRELIYQECGVHGLPNASYPSADKQNYLAGYEVLINGHAHHWVTTGSRIYPPVARIVMNESQDIHGDLKAAACSTKHAALVTLLQQPARRPTSRDGQLLTALSWYNRANSEYANDDHALLNLAIAFEALLDLPEGKGVTERFTEAITLLLGRVPRLKSWAIQFYDTRSDIAHKGSTQRLRFLAADDPKMKGAAASYKPLIAYGRQIFQLCAATIASGARLAEDAQLASQLTTNAERFQAICKTLKMPGEAAQLIAATSDDVDDIETFRFQSETGLTIEQLTACARLMVDQYLKTSPHETEEVLLAMRDLVTVSEEFSRLGAIERISAALGPPTGESGPRRTVQTLVDGVWHYVFLYYYNLKEQKAKGEKGETAKRDGAQS